MAPPIKEGWWTIRGVFADRLRTHGSIRAMSRATGVPYGTLQKWSKRHGVESESGNDKNGNKGGRPKEGEQPRVEVRGDRATIITDPRKPEDLGDLDGLIRRRGLNPDEWEITHVTVNEWEAYAGRDEADEPIILTLRQLKASLKRKVALDWLFPAVEVAQRLRPSQGSSSKLHTKLVVVCGDQQAGYHDEALHQAFTRWLADVQPDLGALTGDTLDLPTISRHADRPHWNATPQECINAGYRLLSDYVDASPGTSWRKLRGNHDWRLESELLTRAERMFGLSPADTGQGEQVPLYSIRRFLHLDALGIELVGREGDKWELAESELAPGVYVRHQPPNMKKLTRLHRSIVAGDTHRQGIQQVTTWHGDEPHVITLVETGCMCQINGLGYVEHPDWQQGFATIALGADGNVGYDLAVWRDGTLTWRGETWKA